MNAPDAASKRNSIVTLAAGGGFALAGVAGIAALLAGLGTRWGWWDYRDGFFILRCAVWVGLAAAVISLVALVIALRLRWRRGLVFGIHGLIIGALVFGVPWFMV